MIQQEYYALMQTYSSLYGIAQEKDARVVQDAWVNSYEQIGLSITTVQETMTTYLATAESAYNDYATVVAELTPTIEDHINNMTSDIENTTTAA